MRACGEDHPGIEKSIAPPAFVPPELFDKRRTGPRAPEASFRTSKSVFGVVVPTPALPLVGKVFVCARAPCDNRTRTSSGKILRAIRQMVCLYRGVFIITLLKTEVVPRFAAKVGEADE